MKRRGFLLAILTLPTTAWPQAAGVAVRVELLKEFVQIVGDAGDAIGKLTEGFKKLVVASKDSYNYVAAQREQKRLLEIAILTTEMTARSNYRVEDAINNYHQGDASSRPRPWTRLVRSVAQTLAEVEQLLANVKKEDSAFVLEPVYRTLNDVLYGRERLLLKLLEMPAPETDEEFKILLELREKYRYLHTQTEIALTQLTEYIHKIGE
jgi:hypothetical protein